MAPPTKRRRLGPVSVSAVEEVTFDPSARQEYLTGFHKRKLARAKHARELAEKKEREERIRERKRVREGRKEELKRHVEEVNAIWGLGEEGREGKVNENVEAESGDYGGDIGGDEDAVEDGGEGEVEKEGIGEGALDHEDEYVDEDKFTTVLVEEVDVDREGLHKSRPNALIEAEGDDGRDAETVEAKTGERRDRKNVDGKRTRTKEKPKDAKSKPKEKRKKFRYENKAERKFTREKERSKNRKQASARRKGE